MLDNTPSPVICNEVYDTVAVDTGGGGDDDDDGDSDDASYVTVVTVW